MSNTTPKSELIYTKSKPIDQLNILDGIRLMVDEQKEAALEVGKSELSIVKAIEEIYNHLKFNTKGRFVYVGAGTSGRIGVQDGVELFPTFNWPKNRLEYIIAGGLKSLLFASENSEDNVIKAKQIVDKKSINSQDVVIGIAASGNTPFTCEVMRLSKLKKALTIVITNNPNGKILEYGKVKVVLDTKEEVIAGSTRLKAGTAQKICLNIISSLVMTKFGRVKDGLMTNMVPTNEKLRNRKRYIESKT